VGDGFSEDVALRRRALDLAFTCMMQEAAEHERSRARLTKLSSTGSITGAAAGAGGGTGGAAAAGAAGNGALVLAGQSFTGLAGAGAGAGATDAGGKGE
jgi:hypothetical protein